MTDEEALQKLAKAIKGHQFNYTSWDTGIAMCRHPEHGGWYIATCWKAHANKFLDDVRDGVECICFTKGNACGGPDRAFFCHPACEICLPKRRS